MAGDKATISRESFYKSLGKLEALAGVQHQTQQPQINPEAIVEKMQKGEQLTEEEMTLVKSQICTGGNSERTSWPGGNTSDVPGNGPGADKIKPNGTDYNERGVRKSIMEKVAKGVPLTADELALLKSDLDKGDIDKAGDAVDKGNDKDKEEFGRDMGKSLGDHVQENDTLQKGIEVSEFLAEFAKSFGAATESSENRTMAFVQDIGQQLFNALHEMKAEQADFNKSLAEAVLNIGHGVAGSMEQVAQVAEMPVGAPRSQQLRAIPGGQQQGFVQKGMGDGGEQISKSMMTEAMTDMLEKGEGGISPVEIIKFDSTGEIRPELQAKVVARIQGAGR